LDNLVYDDSHNITELVLRGREGLRSIWNVSFRALFDGERIFGEVERILFDALIGSQLREQQTATAPSGLLYYSNICVRAKVGLSFVEALVPTRREHDVNWQRQQIDADSLDLRLARFFDFGGLDEEYRDFEYVELVVGNPGVTSAEKGSVLLVKALDMLFYEKWS
jgi:hypothetical protein